MPPVEDHPVHERTRIDVTTYRHGCFNRPDYKDGYWAPDRRYYPDGRFEQSVVWIPFRMTKECKYDQSAVDPFCDECKHTRSKK